MKVSALFYVLSFLISITIEKTEENISTETMAI